jgi:hypothetical protein
MDKPWRRDFDDNTFFFPIILAISMAASRDAEVELR